MSIVIGDKTPGVYLIAKVEPKSKRLEISYYSPLCGHVGDHLGQGVTIEAVRRRAARVRGVPLFT
jgi:hypothetical protein